MKIKNFAYELYKAKWIGSHCNLQILEETIVDAFEEGTSVQDYVREYGFKGLNECFVSYEEFIDNEYQEEECMVAIFDGEKKYIDLWKKDLENNKLNLPREEEISRPCIEDFNEMAEYISSYLRNEYGFCVNSFKFDFDMKKIYIYDIDWDITE